MLANYKRPHFFLAGIIVAAFPAYLAIGQLLDQSPIAAGIFGFVALMAIGFGDLMAGRRA